MELYKIFLLIFGLSQITRGQQHTTEGVSQWLFNRNTIIQRLNILSDNIFSVWHNTSSPTTVNNIDDLLQMFDYHQKKELARYIAIGFLISLADTDPDLIWNMLWENILENIPYDEAEVLSELHVDSFLSYFPDLRICYSMVVDIRNHAFKIANKTSWKAQSLIQTHIGKPMVNIKDIIRLYYELDNFPKIRPISPILNLATYFQNIMMRYFDLESGIFYTAILNSFSHEKEYGLIFPHAFLMTEEVTSSSVMILITPLLVKIVPYLLNKQHNKTEPLYKQKWDQKINNPTPYNFNKETSTLTSNNQEYEQFRSTIYTYIENLDSFRHEEQLENIQTLISIYKTFINSPQGKLIWHFVSRIYLVNPDLMSAISILKSALIQNAKDLNEEHKIFAIIYIIQEFKRLYKPEALSQFKVGVVGTLDTGNVYDLLSKIEFIIEEIHSQLELEYPMKKFLLNPFKIYISITAFAEDWFDWFIFRIHKMSDDDTQTYIEESLNEAFDGIKYFISALEDPKCLPKKMCLLKDKTEARRNTARAISLLWSFAEALEGNDVSLLAKLIEAGFTTKDCQVLFPEECSPSDSSLKATVHLESDL